MDGVEDDLSSEQRPLLGTRRTPTLKSKRNLLKLARGLGAALCIAVAVASWVTMAQLLRDVDEDYSKPFSLAYFIHSFLAIFYIGWKLWSVFPGNLACNRVGEGALTNFKYLAISTAILAVIMYFGDVFWYFSLSMTSLSANTAVYQSVSAVVFMLSIPVLHERVSVLKVFSVTLTIVGVTLISVFTDEQRASTPSSNSSAQLLGREPTPVVNSTPLGYVYLAASVLFYAVMEVGFKKYATAPDDPATVQNSFRGLGYIGVHTLLWLWPVSGLLHLIGYERFELPDLETFYHILANVGLDLVFNISFFMCIALSSPLITAVGTVLVVPASVLVDWQLHDYILPWEAIVGTIGILAGFFGLISSECAEILCWQEDSAHLGNDGSKRKHKWHYLRFIF